jgi:uncharacterized protein GlcG (DUF336 family)
VTAAVTSSPQEELTLGISLRDAQAMIDRTRGHANVIGVPMNIAVTDGGGHRLAFGRMDGAILGSIGIALAKLSPVKEMP